MGDTILFLGNMGVLIKRPAGDILVDALYGSGLPDYDVVEASMRERLETAQPPFDGVTLVLATHRHRDHFDAAAIGRFLEHAPSAVFVGPADAHAALDSLGRYSQRVYGLTRAAVMPALAATAGVAALDLPHGRTANPAINLGYYIRIGNKTVLHTGDASLEAGHWAALEEQHGAPLPVSVAIVPYWHITSDDTRALVQDRLRPSRTLLTHIPRAAVPDTPTRNGRTLRQLPSMMAGSELVRGERSIPY